MSAAASAAHATYQRRLAWRIHAWTHRFWHWISVARRWSSPEDILWRHLRLIGSHSTIIMVWTILRSLVYVHISRGIACLITTIGSTTAHVSWRTILAWSLTLVLIVSRSLRSLSYRICRRRLELMSRCGPTHSITWWHGVAIRTLPKWLCWSHSTYIVRTLGRIHWCSSSQVSTGCHSDLRRHVVIIFHRSKIDVRIDWVKIFLYSLNTILKLLAVNDNVERPRTIWCKLSENNVFRYTW